MRIISIALVAVLSLSGCSSMKKTDTDEVTQALDTHTKLDHTKAAHHNIELGLRYYEQGQIPRAKTKFRRAIELAPKVAETHYSYAYFLEKVGELEDAQKEYQIAIEKEPDSATARNNYGTFLCRQGAYLDADKQFNKAIESPHYPNAAEAMENAGLCILEVPDIKKAIGYFERSLRHDPYRPHANLELAIIKFKQGDFRGAKELYRKYEGVAAPTARSLLLGVELAKVEHDKNQQASLALKLKHNYPQATIRDLYALK